MVRSLYRATVYSFMCEAVPLNAPLNAAGFPLSAAICKELNIRCLKCYLVTYSPSSGSFQCYLDSHISSAELL